MNIDKIKNLKLYLFFIFSLFLFLFYYFVINKFQKEKALVSEPIEINLLTSVHSNLLWDFKPVKSKITVKPGDVTTIEYLLFCLDFRVCAS